MLIISLFWISTVFLYYRWFKGIVFAFVHRLIRIPYFDSLRGKYNPQELAGVIELIIIALSHVLLCFTLLYILGLSFSDIGLKSVSLLDLVYGALLGIAEMSLSSLLCLAAIKLMQKKEKDLAPQTNEEWQTIARGGWVRHHIQSFEILPFFAALFVLLLQVGSEELIFRGIIVGSFTKIGVSWLISIPFSLTLFIVMQAFHTPGLKTALFPMIGATLMGTVHALLYYLVPSLPPLIIAHVVFFLMTVI